MSKTQRAIILIISTLLVWGLGTYGIGEFVTHGFENHDIGIIVGVVCGIGWGAICGNIFIITWLCWVSDY